jgi:hypothetical protein
MFKLEWFHVAIVIILIYSFEIFSRSLIVNSKMPQAVVDFPVYETTEEEYNSLKQEIELFVLDALENRRSELSLNTKQLNCISTRGTTPLKGTAMFPEYYEIDNNKLIENGLSYPSTHSFSGYLITVRVIEFAGTMYCSKLTSINGCPPSSDDSETLVSHIKDFRLFRYFCDFNRDRMDELAKKLTIVEIVDDKLIMRV